MSTQSAGSTRVIIVALGANLGIALAKLVGAAVTRSASMFAEAIHSLVDSTNQLLLLVGAKKSQQSPSDLHPLGYGRESFFWAFIVAVLLFSMGGLFAIYEGVHRYIEVVNGTAELRYPWIGLGILVVSLALEGYSFKVALAEVRVQNTEKSIWLWVKNTTSADLLVIFLEDLGALLGLGVATVSLLLAIVTGNPIYDACGSVIVGLLLIVIAIVLSIEIKSLLLGEAPSENFRPQIEKIVGENLPGGTVLRFIAIQLSGTEVLISYKIHPGEVRMVSDLIAAINKIEEEVKMRFPSIRWQFVEPDYEV